MTTPLVLSFLLSAPFLVALVCKADTHVQLFCGVVGIMCVIALTGVGHFVKTEAMARMIPAPIPAPTTIVIVSGIVELVAAVKTRET